MNCKACGTYALEVCCTLPWCQWQSQICFGTMLHTPVGTPGVQFPSWVVISASDCCCCCCLLPCAPTLVLRTAASHAQTPPPQHVPSPPPPVNPSLAHSMRHLHRLHCLMKAQLGALWHRHYIPRYVVVSLIDQASTLRDCVCTCIVPTATHCTNRHSRCRDRVSNAQPGTA
jgi:hypothetical protein